MTTKRMTRVAPDVDSGVYFLFRRKELVYVGRSNCPQERVETHRRNGRAFDRAVIAYCEPGDSIWMEAALIKALAPAQNRAGKPMHDPLPEEPSRTPAPQVIEKVVYRDVPVVRRYDPEEVRPVTSYSYEMTQAHLGPEYKAAIASGEIPSCYRSPERTGPGARRLVRRGDVELWLAEQKRKRFAA